MVGRRSPQTPSINRLTSRPDSVLSKCRRSRHIEFQHIKRRHQNGLPTFEKLRFRSNDQSVILIAFDLLELDGNDLRREPLEVRKATLRSVLRGCLPGVQFNEHLPHPGDVVFDHACKMGLEGIVSKRLGSIYRSGRSPDWLKFKNPEAPAVKREAEEDWGKKGWQ
jgi:ATP-dependent DNA ligase